MAVTTEDAPRVRVSAATATAGGSRGAPEADGRAAALPEGGDGP